jgi:sialic acid synthase SpsE
VSTGMCDLEDVQTAVDLVAFGMTTDKTPAGKADFDGYRTEPDAARAVAKKLTLLHCTSLYPAPARSANLRAMQTMRDAFGLAVGYSDHTIGATVAVAAVAAGASVIEKHLTLDRAMTGPDHAVSMEPAAFAAMVADIRTVETALGSNTKEPVADEHEMRTIARKSLVAARSVSAWSLLGADDVSAKRPGGGVTPMTYWDLLGTSAPTPYDTDDWLVP